MFSMRPDSAKNYQTAGRDLSGLLKMQQDALSGIVGELDSYGQRTRGGEILDAIKNMTPEQRKNANLLAMIGGNTQSKQTLDTIRGMVEQDESQKQREFSAEEARKNRNFQANEHAKSRAGAETLARLKNKLDKGEPLSDVDRKKISGDLKDLDVVLNQLRGQWSSAADRDKPYILAEIQDKWRQKVDWERRLDPNFAKGVESEYFKNYMPGQFQMGKAFPVNTK